MKRKSALNESKRFRSVGVILFLVIGGLVSLGLFADQWQKNYRTIRLSVSGAHVIGIDEIRKYAAIPDSTSLADLDLHAIAKRIGRHPYVFAADLTRNPPDELSIVVTERQPIAIVMTPDERCYHIDKDGVVLPAVFTNATSDLPIITGVDAEVRFVPGKRVLVAKLQQALEIVRTAAELGNEFGHLISEVALGSGRDLVLYTMENGIPVIFGPSLDAERKLRAFDAFWRTVVQKAGSAKLEYVDVRFKERLVVKWNEQFYKPAPAVRDSLIMEL